MTNKTEREIITTTTAEPNGAVPEYDPADTTDAALIEAERRFNAYSAWWDADKSHYDDDEARRRGQFTSALQSFLAKTPAKTREGLAVKLRMLHFDVAPDRGSEAPSVWTIDLIETAQAALARLP